MPDERSLRVLVVDDDQDTAETTAALVAGWGYAVVVAGNGATAVKTAAVFEPNVVLLDLSLPDAHGYDIARQLRQEAPGRRMLFVAITGWGQPADQLQSAAAGFSHHLVKPLPADDLERILAAHQAAEQARGHLP